ncbi:cyclin PHO80-like protein, partial [Syncephalis plumigaleata]
FHASAIPSIDLATYLARVLKYCPCASECFIALVIYVERACNSGMVQLDRFSAHRLCITGVVVASKFFSDVFFTNSRYAKVGGLPTKELNQLELIFLKLCNFQLSIPVEEL